MQLKIGELAKRTGLTVRTLHHYDNIGLLQPSSHSDSGYRLYNRDDMTRLYRIQSLRRLSLPLADIQRLLDNEGASLSGLIASHIDELEQQAQQALALRKHLLAMQQHLGGRQEPTMDDWLTALERMVNSRKYFSEAELDQLRVERPATRAKRREESAALLRQLRAAIAAGASPEDPQAQEISCRWMETVEQDAGGDAALLIKIYTMQSEEPALQFLSGLDRATLDFTIRAMACARLAVYTAYCEPEEMAQLRRHSLSDAVAWPPLIAALRRQLDAGAPPDGPAVQALAGEWRQLSLKKAGGDAALQTKLQRAFLNEPTLRTGIDDALLHFIQQALQATP